MKKFSQYLTEMNENLRAVDASAEQLLQITGIDKIIRGMLNDPQMIKYLWQLVNTKSTLVALQKIVLPAFEKVFYQEHPDTNPVKWSPRPGDV